jgi:hypothetical protein
LVYDYKRVNKIHRYGDHLNEITGINRPFQTVIIN